MWAPVAVLLALVASAIGAIGGDDAESTPATAGTAVPAVRPAMELGLGLGVTPTDRGIVASEASARIEPVLPVETDDALERILAGASLPVINDGSTIPGVDLRMVQDALPGVAGDPKLLSSFAGRNLLESGRLSLEAGVQVPLFDDRPGLPEPEFLLQFRLQF